MTARAKIRLFVESPLASGNRAPLHSGQAHYLAHVMRLGPGEPILVFNGRDGEWLARVERLGKTGGAVTVETLSRPQGPSPDLWLAFAPLKKTATDFLIEKATELGVVRLLPVFTRRTAAERVNLGRLRSRAIEAAEQCERLTVPEIAEPIDVTRLIATWPKDRLLLVLDETGAGRPIAEVLAEQAPPGRGFVPVRHGFLSGPEGGFEPHELDGLAELPFAVRVGLGPRILRAETAALAALACWQALAGDGRQRAPARTRA
jgi:16S rRNA (uracil1498-N3)-methyltransferase